MAKPFIFMFWKDVKVRGLVSSAKDFVLKSMSANKVIPLSNKILEVTEPLGNPSNCF